MCHPDSPKLSQKHINFHGQIDHHKQKLSVNNTVPKKLDLLNPQIQKHEVLNCIHCLEKDKAYGPDMIHNLMIVHGEPAPWTQLLNLFNKCLTKGTFPSVWNCANVCPIPKPRKIHTIPKKLPPDS